MNKLTIVQTLNKMKFQAIKHSPEILMVTGIVGAVGATVLACKSTLKLQAVLDKKTELVNQIHETSGSEDYTEQDAKKDLKIVYASTVLDIAKLYTPSVILGAASITCLICSHNVLKNRNAALAAAFATVTESFNNYRKSVVERYGERADFEIRHGIRTEKVNVTETDENGKKKTRKENIDVVDGLSGCSEYSRIFDEYNNNWTKDPELNRFFLTSQERYANDRLKSQGYLFLSDVYKSLGFEETKASRVVGWTYNPDQPNGDNYISFGIYDVNVAGYQDDRTCDTIGEQRAEFINGLRPSVLLDFNVDGNILDLM